MLACDIFNFPAFASTFPKSVNVGLVGSFNNCPIAKRFAGQVYQSGHFGFPG
jgi:hypothetical protein